jgi:hypothetical protein
VSIPICPSPSAAVLRRLVLLEASAGIAGPRVTVAPRKEPQDSQSA